MKSVLALAIATIVWSAVDTAPVMAQGRSYAWCAIYSGRSMGGSKSCSARGRNRCGLRSMRSDSACALSGRAARSGTRRLGLGMPGGRPRGLPELPFAKRPRASRARGTKRSGPSD